MSGGKEEGGQLKTGNELEGHIVVRRGYNEMENQSTLHPHEEAEADLQKFSWTSNFLISIFILGHSPKEYPNGANVLFWALLESFIGKY